MWARTSPTLAKVRVHIGAPRPRCRQPQGSDPSVRSSHSVALPSLQIIRMIRQSAIATNEISTTSPLACAIECYVATYLLRGAV